MSDKEQDGSQDNDVKDLQSQSSSHAIPAQEDLLPFMNTKQEDFVYSYQNVKPFDSNFKVDPLFTLLTNANILPYTISVPIKAQVLIVNIEIYKTVWDKIQKTQKERAGSAEDVNSMCQALQKLGIDSTNIHIRGPEVDRKDLTKAIQEFAKSNKDTNKNLDVFIMVILAHGDVDNGKEVILTSDHKKVQLKKEIISPFLEDDANLAGKPKLFFVQACRGKTRDEGIKVDTMSGEGDDQVPLPAQEFAVIPTEADVLVAYPSATDHKSARTEKGSYFIQCLANRLLGDAAERNEELNTIMTRVANDVSRCSYSIESQPGKSFKQAVWWSSSLRHPFHFKSN